MATLAVMPMPKRSGTKAEAVGGMTKIRMRHG